MTAPAKTATKGQTRARRKAEPSTKKGVSRTDDGLTGKQLLALCALIRGETQQAAARAAGLSYSGFQYLLTVPAFKAALAAAQLELRETAKIDAAGIVDELMPALTSDIREFIGPNGTIRPVSEWTPAMGKAVASIETEEIFEGYGEERTWVGNTMKLKFWPKTEAADKIARVMGLFAPEKKQVDLRVGVVVVPAKSKPIEHDVVTHQGVRVVPKLEGSKP